MAAAEEKESKQATDFSGTWSLVTNENLDAFLQSQGVAYLQRTVAAKASITVQIVHKGDALNITTTISMKVVTKEQKVQLTLDGTVVDTTAPSGDAAKVSAVWSDDKTKIILDTENLTKKTTATIERTMPDQNQMKDVVTNKHGVSCTRIFKRIK
mmetsp:Transcript_31226/g.50650  ORF Transcript_31226/g.50650 Transcript_31226/m.50650 type:complete len:155 (+) Transcript_31226:35-499(+)